MESLVEMGSRYPGTDGHGQAVLYITQVLQSYEATAAATRISYVPHGPHQPQNVLVTYGRGAREIVLGAHYDSIADRTAGWRAQEDPAPGANDNATGAAALLEIARILAAEERAGRLRESVTLAFFDEEEVGMQGSRAWVRARAGTSLVINLDMVGFSAPGKQKLDVVRYGNSGDLLDRARAANERYGLGLQLVDRLLPADLRTWVDSTPFAMAGIPAITLTESYGQPGIDYPGYPAFHRVTDTPDQIDNPPQWKAATQLVLAMALELAR